MDIFINVHAGAQRARYRAGSINKFTGRGDNGEAGDLIFQGLWVIIGKRFFNLERKLRNAITKLPKGEIFKNDIGQIAKGRGVSRPLYRFDHTIGQLIISSLIKPGIDG